MYGSLAVYCDEFNTNYIKLDIATLFVTQRITRAKETPHKQLSSMAKWGARSRPGARNTHPFPPLQYVKTRESLEETIATYSKPSSDALLPAMDLLYPPQLAPMVRTLVIDLEDTIVHSEYRRDRGWITYKRPGVQEFLQAAWNLGWEVVLYTDQDHMSAEPIMEQIDPGRRFVPFRLFRDSTLFTGGLFKPGLHLRDLSRLNR